MAGSRGGGGGAIRGALTAEPCTKKFVDVYNSVLCSIYIYIVHLNIDTQKS
jgi:hypothetical protein